MADKYEDIINMEHPTSKKHSRMSLYARAAQFAPFAALTGHDAAVAEVARLTDKKIELNQEQIDMLNTKISYLNEHIKDEPEITVTYFIPDDKKAGGAYFTVNGQVRRFDEYEGTVILTDKKQIPLRDILTIESDLFPSELDN